ncbi:MAG TPA: transporter [Candidatus Omnitrophota bacterium]|nr:transporter [Candidatus Omnitrophota bacterium]HPD84539.1 transporter [Candidatus Omnitrophota bacterium]HRZ03397.1 transporter [Candidatus Omnitrophota bacterium]
MFRKILGCLLGVCLLGFGVTACAQEQADTEEWYPPSAGPVTTWTSPVCGKGELYVQPFFFYNNTRGTFDDDGHSDSLPEGDRQNQFQEQFFFQYGLTNRLEVAGQMVYQQNYLRQDNESAHAKGLGDTYAYLRYCLLEEKKALPHITGIFQLKIPTAKFQKAGEDKLGIDIMGDGSYDPGYGVILTKRIKPFILHADAIYSIPTTRKVDGVKTLNGKYVTADVGVEYFFFKNFNLMLEGNFFSQGDIRADGELTPASDSASVVISPGIGWSNEKIQCLLAYQRVVLGTNTNANDSVLATFVYGF